MLKGYREDGTVLVDCGPPGGVKMQQVGQLHE